MTLLLTITIIMVIYICPYRGAAIGGMGGYFPPTLNIGGPPMYCSPLLLPHSLF